MISRIAIIIILLLSFAAAARAQLYQWRTYTNKDEITSLNYFGGDVWATTTGGLVRFDPLLDRIQTYIKDNGLGSIRLSFSVYAGDSIAYIGSSDGVLSRIDLRDDTFENYIFEGRDGERIQLYNADTSAGFLWIGSDIGVIKFDRFRHGGEVKEIYRTLGDFGPETPVYDVAIFKDKIYAATPEGLAYADYTSPYLLDPTEWQTNVFGVDNTLTGLESVGDLLYIGGNLGLYYLRNVDTIFATSINSARVYDLAATANGVYVVAATGSQRGLYHVVGGDAMAVTVNSVPTGQLNTVTIADTLYLGTDSKGVYRQSGSTFARLPVPGPASNDLIGGGVTADGALYAISKNGNFARLKDSVWQTITAPNVEKVSTTLGDDSSVWIGTWGQGALQYFPDGTQRAFNGANSELKGPNVYPAKVTVVKGLSTDPAGRIWFSSYQASPMRPLVMFDPHDSLWAYFDRSDGITDSNSTCVAAGIGMAALGTENQGMLLVRYGVDPFDHSDDTVKYYSRERRLPSETVNAMAFDRDNRLWVGTPLGLAYFDADIEFYFVVSLPDGVSSDVRALATDSRNNLWVGTTDGLAFISDGQTQKIAFTTGNSELISDEIQGLSYDVANGELLVFTRGGLSILDYSPSSPDSSARVYAYPNPFIVPTGVDALLRFNINQRAAVRVYTVAGELVRTTDVNTGWNGRNNADELVASGVYIYHLIAEDGSRHTGKILVVRK